MKVLWLKGCAGLGNRLISIDNAIKYAKKSHRTICIDWSDGMFGAQGHNVFTDFFEVCDIPYLSDVKVAADMLADGCSRYPSMLDADNCNLPVYAERQSKGLFNAYFPFLSRLRGYKYLMSSFRLHTFGYLLGLPSFQACDKTQMSWFKAFSQRNDGKNMPMGGNLSLSLDEDIVLYADFRPMTNMSDVLKHVRLHQDFLNKINTIADDLGIRDAVGVHVRFTDKKANGSFDNLFAKLAKEKRPVFLCTDNEEIVQLFKDNVSYGLVLYQKYIPKVTDGGIHIWASQMNDQELKYKMFEDSIIEMWLLSMTYTLYWQGNSSFSYISKLLMSDNHKCIDWTTL